MNDGIARMGEVVFSSKEIPVLRALGLGSCIGLCVFDSTTKMGCLAHIMLPESRDKNGKEICKYADTAIPYVLEEMSARGAIKSRLKIAIVGGAQLFSFEGAGARLDVGKRNIEAVSERIKANNLKILASDVGGKSGRTMIVNSISGEVFVKQVGGEEKPLIRFYN